MFELFDRKVKRGAGDLFKYKFEYKCVSNMKVVHRHPIDITNWEFTLFVHEKPVYKTTQCVFSLKGEVADELNGTVIFQVPKELTDIESNTYWYSIYFKKPSGHEGWLDGAKYIVVDTLNPYYSIYPEMVENKNYKSPVKPIDFADYADIIEGQEDI